MNSKKRVLETIAHREPDQVPIGEWGIDHDHVSKIIGRECFWRNRKETTLALWDNRRDEVVDCLKQDLDDIMKALDYDIITVELVTPKSHHVSDRPRQIADGVWEDSKGHIYKYASSNDSILSMDPSEGKFELTDEDVARAMDRAEHFDESRFELLDYACEKYGKEKAILCRSIDIYGQLISPFGGDTAHQLMLTVLAPEEIEKLRPACILFNQKIIDHCKKKGVDILMTGYDYGMNSGTIMRPDTIRSIFFPMMDQINANIKEAGMIPFFHCCGNIWAIMDDFISSGFQGYQSIQVSAGMNNARMKKEYGDKLTLWTGVQCETLIKGSLQDTENEVRSNLELLMPGGGFIFGSTNSVQYAAKTENYVRALELVRKYGRY